jgi:large subunit ribosomal protein L4
MTVQKFIKYNSLDINGQVLNDEHQIELNVLETSGNYLIHRDVLRQQISQKQGTVATKTRSEVRGGGRKPWRQKGTGRARAGSNRSPLWRGGGVIFGPKPKKTILKLNKKERKLALQTLLYNKRNQISVIENLETAIDTAKTQTFFNICKNCNVNLDQKVLVVVSKKTPALTLSIRNMKNVELVSASNLNTLSVLKAKQILLTPLAVNKIKETYCG